jgi:hypothetical protein
MLLTSCQPCENVKVNDAVKRLVELYVNLPAPNDTSEHSVAFMSWLKELVDKGLLAVNTTQTTGRVDRAQIHNAERILLTLAKKKPEVVDAYAPTLVKIVQKFTREHHAHMVQARQGNRQVMSLNQHPPGRRNRRGAHVPRVYKEAHIANSNAVTFPCLTRLFGS